MFWRIKTIWIKFPIFNSQKSLPVFISFFLFYFGPQVFLLLSFWPSHTLSHFFAGPVSSSILPRIRATNPISFGHLRPLHTSRRLQPPRLPCHSTLCHPPSAPWSCLAPPPKCLHPIASPSPFPSPVTGVIEVPLLLPPSPWLTTFYRPTAL
jgi:hypothetical protein